MPAIREYPCTNAQFEFVQTLESDGHDIFRDLTWRAIRGLQAQDAANALPNDENEDGQRIPHRSRVIVRNVARIYYAAAQAMASSFERGVNRGYDYFPYMYLRNRMNDVSIGWIDAIVASNNGVPPEVWNYTDTNPQTQQETV